MNTISDRFLLDTHTWVWLRENDTRMSEQTFALIERAQQNARLFISAASVWELGNLESAGRIKLNMPIDPWLESAYRVGLQSIAITSKIALASNRLPGTIHKDPADRILAATARTENLILLTRDKLLLTYAAQGHLRAHKI
jgi:PIN domain nuclease of toxin-antitoxin system